MTDWFEALTGFHEADYLTTRSNLELHGEQLRSKANGRRFRIGRLETPTLADLRVRGTPLLSGLTGRLLVSAVSGEARAMHRDPAHSNALFQVASQFNLLEMTGPNVTPEEGVTRYAHDHTQGPACAIAAGAATLYRNYLAPVAGQAGQTHDRQIDCLRDVGEALGNTDGSLWTMRNGYALCTQAGLARIDSVLATSSDEELDALRAHLRIGLHWDVDVTDMPAPNHRVSQAFCSALPVAYTRVPAQHWARFATLVLEASYEATLWAGVINAHERRSRLVCLTHVGGGAFGNLETWIHAAQLRALEKFSRVDLDVRLVSFGAPSQAQTRLAEHFN